MDLAEKLRKESYSEHVAFTEFILKLKNNKSGLFCFFEGKDDYKYYGLRISNITQRDFEDICCGNKEEVIKLEKLISSKSEYTEIDTLYFVDNDYSEDCEFDNIYCLPSYSIENQYTSINVLERILKQEFGLDKNHDDFKKVIKFYKQTRQEFHSKTLIINSWLSCQQEIREQKETNTYLRIDSTIGQYFKQPVKTNLNSIVDFDDLENKEKIENLFKESPKISTERIDKEIEKLKKLDGQKSFRGKFELRFFVSFLNRLQGEICKKNPELFEEKHKCSLKFEYPNALTSLSIYADTPNCLFQYLKKYILNAA